MQLESTEILHVSFFYLYSQSDTEYEFIISTIQFSLFSKNFFSLRCVKQHKVTKKCSGVRDKTAYVSIKNFNESHLLSGKFCFVVSLFFLLVKMFFFFKSFLLTCLESFVLRRKTSSVMPWSRIRLKKYCVSQKKRAPTNEMPSNKFCFKEDSYICII